MSRVDEKIQELVECLQDFKSIKSRVEDLEVVAQRFSEVGKERLKEIQDSFAKYAKDSQAVCESLKEFRGITIEVQQVTKAVKSEIAISTENCLEKIKEDLAVLEEKMSGISIEDKMLKIYSEVNGLKKGLWWFVILLITVCVILMVGFSRG